ncbi:hypothetical protein LzC2_21640 [Planctomycetes bacterium LzC2]|uniref:DUF7691 domain-containing protein n=2 Tax=Alienimonas chondri TaxID=2681879 RepID=A0ABX1VDW2_9PLAN|nr:hypothetical protein [Alienimonas chondri]
MFYGVDPQRLRSLYGSNDEAFLDRFLADPPEGFEGASCCDLEPDEALRRIVAGTAEQDGDKQAGTYGYVLKGLCEHFTDGELLDGEVACVRDLPYALRLPGSGSPIPIPVDEADFPEIGFLLPAEIEKELAALDAPPGKPKKPPLRMRILGWALQKRLGIQLPSLRTPSAEELQEEVEQYRLALQDARARGTGIVSFRH